MIIDRHTSAGWPRRTGDVDRSMRATMRQAGVAAAVVAAIADIPGIRRDPELAAPPRDRGMAKVCSGDWPLVFRAVRA
jgi:hypothetical protein